MRNSMQRSSSRKKGLRTRGGQEGRASPVTDQEKPNRAIACAEDRPQAPGAPGTDLLTSLARRLRERG